MQNDEGVKQVNYFINSRNQACSPLLSFHLPKTPAECSDQTQNNASGFIHIHKAGEDTAVDSCL